MNVKEEAAVMQMRLAPEPFAAIKSGLKIYELRLFDKKRQRLNMGDVVCFTDIKSGEKLFCSVEEIKVFDDFEKLYAALPATEIGYAVGEKADPTDMNAYYSGDEIRKYGVVAIKIKNIV